MRVVVLGGAVFVLAITLFSTGLTLQGVNRWIWVGTRLHAGAVILPLSLVLLANLSDVSFLIGAFGFMIILFLQPDAAEATAFAAGAITLRACSGPAKRWSLSLEIALLASVACLTWYRPDPLLPIPHVEGMVKLAFQDGSSTGISALLSLVLLPLPFVYAAAFCISPASRATALSIATYLTVRLLTTFSGLFPVPLLGYGTSSVIGYVLVCSWLRTLVDERQP